MWMRAVWTNEMQKERRVRKPEGWTREETETKSAERAHVGFHSIAIERRVVEWAERVRLVRYWERYGPQRPLLFTTSSEVGASVWVAENKVSAQHRFKVYSNNPYLVAYQVNQQTGEWTHTRQRVVYPGAIVEVLEKGDKRVVKAWRWVLAKRLTGGEGR